MASVTQLMDALRKADAAGNTADARRLSQLIRQAQGRSAAPTNNQSKPVDTSFSSAFKSGIDAPLENIATTAKAVGFDDTASTLSNLTDAPTNYESAANRFINPQQGDAQLFGYGIGFLPRAFVEQMGQYTGSLITRGAGAGLGTAVAGPAGGVAGALAGPALFEFVQQLGPIALERAKNNGREEPSWDDWTAAAGSAGLSGALNAIGVKGGGLLNSMLKEGVTEGVQSAVTQTGESLGTEAGLDVSAKEAIGEGIIGGTSAGSVQAPIAVARGTANASRAAVNLVSGGGSGPRDAEAAADFARDLQTIADDAGHDLKDVDPASSGGAGMAIKDVHASYGEDMKSLARVLRGKLNYKDSDADADRMDKVIAKTALRKGKNKATNIVNKQDFKTIRKIVGDTAEGQQLIAILRKTNELTRVHDAGLKGGVSQLTDLANPFEANAGYSNSRNIVGTLAGLTGLGAAVGTGGASIPIQAGVIATGRGIDAMTGRRSRVAKYINDNAQNKGIASATAPSLASQNQQAQAEQDANRLAEVADRREEALSATRANAPSTPNSPQDTVEQATGLDRAGVARILRTLKRSPNQTNVIKRAIEEYETSIATGGTVKDLSPLIRRINLTVENNPTFLAQRVREPVRNRDEGGSPSTDAKTQRGMDDNAKAIRLLREDADNDNDLNDFDKQIINKALDRLSLNLGSDPLSAAETILQDATAVGRNKRKVNQYIKPYVDRVKRQQRSKKSQ